MKFSDLKMIYPSAHIQTSQQVASQDYIAVPVAEGFGIIEKGTLAPKELLLLQLLTDQKELPELAAKHPWYRILFQGESFKGQQLVRILQIRLRNQQDFMQSDWLAEIKDIFPHLLDIFFLDEAKVIIVESQGEQNYTPEEIFGLFQALDTDFDIYSQIYVGSCLLSDHTLADNFALETQIFEKELAHPKNKKEFTLASSLTNALLAEQLTDNQLLKTLYENWFNEEINSILEALWNHQGNVSSAAKELFLHRNTVLYRMEKFQEQTQLDLKKMDDLLLCHLLIATFS